MHRGSSSPGSITPQNIKFLFQSAFFLILFFSLFLEIECFIIPSLYTTWEQIIYIAISVLLLVLNSQLVFFFELRQVNISLITESVLINSGEF